MNEWKIAQIYNRPISSALTSKSEELIGLKPTDCLPSVWSVFLQNAHGAMISGSSFMIDDRFATYRVWCRFVHYKPTKSWKSCNSEAKFVYNVAKRVLMQLQPKIWKETSACTYSLLNVKIILFTSGNFYCLLTRLQQSIKVLVVSTCASPIGLSGESQGNFYKNTKSRSLLYWPDPRNV